MNEVITPEDIIFIGKSDSTKWLERERNNLLYCEEMRGKKLNPGGLRDKAVIILSGEKAWEVYSCFAFSPKTCSVRINPSAKPLFSGDGLTPVWFAIVSRKPGAITQMDKDVIFGIYEQIPGSPAFEDKDTPDDEPEAADEDLEVVDDSFSPPLESPKNIAEFKRIEPLNKPTPRKGVMTFGSKKLQPNQIWAVSDGKQITAAKKIVVVTHEEVSFRECGYEIVPIPEWRRVGIPDAPKTERRIKQVATCGIVVFERWINNSGAVLITDAGVVSALELIGQ